MTGHSAPGCGWRTRKSGLRARTATPCHAISGAATCARPLPHAHAHSSRQGPRPLQPSRAGGRMRRTRAVAGFALMRGVPSTCVAKLGHHETLYRSVQLQANSHEATRGHAARVSDSEQSLQLPAFTEDQTRAPSREREGRKHAASRACARSVCPNPCYRAEIQPIGNRTGANSCQHPNGGNRRGGASFLRGGARRRRRRR